MSKAPKLWWVAMLLAALLFTACGGGGSATEGTPSAGPGSGVGTGSVTFRLNPSAIPRTDELLASGGVDQLIINILDPETQEPVHPATAFNFDRTQTQQSFTVSQVIPGTHLFMLQVFDSTGALFLSGQQLAPVNPGQVTQIAFQGNGGTGGEFSLAGPAFRPVANADIIQGQPDVDIRDDGFFVVAASVTDDANFSISGYIHGERFQANFSTGIPTSQTDIDPSAGNDFDISQYNTQGMAITNAKNPRLSMNDDGAFTVVWSDSNPSPMVSAGPVIRSVVLGPLNAVNNSLNMNFFEPDPASVITIAAGNSNPASVSMANAGPSVAPIHYAFLDPTMHVKAVQYEISSANSASVPAVGTPPVNELLQTFAPVMSNVNPEVANRKNTPTPAVIVFSSGGASVDAVFEDFNSADTPFVVNSGQPSAMKASVGGLAVDWFESGEIVFVYSVFDSTIMGTGLYARCFMPDKMAIGPELEIVPPVNMNSAILPDVAVVNSDGTFLVTWTQFTGGNSEIMLQRFRSVASAPPVAVGAALDISTGQAAPGLAARNGFNSASRVACTSNGDAVVVWNSGMNTNLIVLARLIGNLVTLTP
ncbi:MAG: hypothetical protein AB7S38_09245 [Vulcanimicrobiota bacterium]